MRCLASASLGKEALKIEVKSGAKNPDKAKAVEGKRTIPDDNRSRSAMTANELRVYERARERSKDGRANLGCVL